MDVSVFFTEPITQLDCQLMIEIKTRVIVERAEAESATCTTHLSG